jgi:AcrR family transcriptional regulator
MARATRQMLLDKAFELFTHHGFHGIGLDRILHEVGVTKTTFYNHFECKDDLILEVIHVRDEFEMSLLREKLRQHGGRTARGQLEALFDVLDEWFNSDEFRGCIFITAAAEFSSPTDPAHEASAAHKRAVCEFLCDLAVNAGSDAPEELAEQLSLLMEGAITVRHVTGNLQAARLAQRTAELVLERYLPPLKAGPTKLVISSPRTA